MTDTEAAITDLRERVAALEAALLAHPTPDIDPPSDADADAFWALTGLEARLGDTGGVLYTGSVPTVGGPVRWQYGATAADLFTDDWSAGTVATSLSALGHPVRLRLLQVLADRPASVAELRDLPDVGSTGQVYHHLGLLQAAGWVRQTTRGHYAVPPERLVPLLATVLAGGRTP